MDMCITKFTSTISLCCSKISNGKSTVQDVIYVTFYVWIFCTLDRNSYKGKGIFLNLYFDFSFIILGHVFLPDLKFVNN